MIEPVGEARPNYYILAELAKRLGYGHLYPQNQEELLGYIMSDSGFTVEALMQADKHVLNNASKKMTYRKWEKGLLRSDGKPGFETPSGKFEIN